MIYLFRWWPGISRHSRTVLTPLFLHFFINYMRMSYRNISDDLLFIVVGALASHGYPRWFYYSWFQHWWVRQVLVDTALSQPVSKERLASIVCRLYFLHQDTFLFKKRRYDDSIFLLLLLLFYYIIWFIYITLIFIVNSTPSREQCHPDSPLNRTYSIAHFLHIFIGYDLSADSSRYL